MTLPPFNSNCPSSMRKRIELPVGLDLTPAMGEPVGLEHQEYDYDETDRDLAQEGDIVLQCESLIDGAAAQHSAQPFHGLRQQHHKRRPQQRAHHGAEASNDDHGEEDDRAIDAEA